MKKQLVIVIGIVIMSILNIFGTYPCRGENIIEYPDNINTIYTVLDNDSIFIETTFNFVNSFNEDAKIQSSIPLEWIYRNEGRGEIFGTQEGGWAKIPTNALFYLINSSITALDHRVFKLRTLVIDNSTPNYPELINIESIITKNISFNNIEVRIPIRRGLDKLSDVKSDLPPTDESVSDEYHIIRWIGGTSKVIQLQYSYSFPLLDYLIPLVWIVVGSIITIIIGFIGKKLKRKIKGKTSKKNNSYPDEKLLTIIKLRYAKGKITKKQFEQMKKDLEVTEKETT